ncbi:hypothetical protein EP837_03208 [Sphingobium sp. EP60837]|nr:hypothetical protein EP837_03208 [Sphingobium sp. EP60837]
MSRYRWKDRYGDLIRRRNPWPLRLEFALLLALTICAFGSLFVPN